MGKFRLRTPFDVPLSWFGGSKPPVYASGNIDNAARNLSNTVNTPVVDWNKINHFIVAIALESASGAKINNCNLRLEWRNKTDAGAWVTLSGTGQLIHGSTNLVEGNSLDLGETICVPVNGVTYIAGAPDGGVEKEGAATFTMGDGVTADQWSEYQVSVDPSNALDNKEYEFRVWDVDNAAILGPSLATITMAGGVARFATLADTVGITDIITETTGKGATLADTVGITDVITRLGTFFRIIADTVGIADVLSWIGAFFRTLADTVGLTDVLAAFKPKLIDTGLIVRYYIDEAASGIGPTHVLDKSGVGADFDLALTYDGVMSYVEDNGNRGLESTSAGGTGQMAEKYIDNSSDKMRDNLVGAQKITMEIVVAPDSFNSGTGRCFAINISFTSPEIGFAGADSTWYIYWEQNLMRNWFVAAGQRIVMHVVYDTTQATPNDRVKVYINGTLTSPTIVTNPTLNDAFALGSGAALYMFNKEGGNYPMDGTLYYAAIYADIAFDQAQITQHYNVLILDDDNPIVILFATLADTVGITDILTRLGTFKRTITDTVGITDTITRIGTFFRTITDTVGITDVLTRIGVFFRTIDDTVGITDTLVAFKVVFVSLADTVGITDVLTNFRNIFKSLDDTVGITDVLSNIRTLFRSITDTVGITDSLTNKRNIFKSIADTVGITDTLVAAKFVLASIADTVGITDVITRLGTFFRTITDTVGITDVLTKIGAFFRTITDTVGITDVRTAVRFVFAALADTVGITGVLARIGTFKRTIADTIGATDVVATARTIIKTITDTIGITDVLSIVVTYIRALSDSASISDFLTANRGFIRSILDTVGITDSAIIKIKKRIIDSFGRSRIAKILGVNKSKIEGVLGISKSDIVKSDDPDKPDIVGK